VSKTREVWIEGENQALAPRPVLKKVEMKRGSDLFPKLKKDVEDMGLSVDGGDEKLPLIVCGCGKQVEVSQALPVVSCGDGEAATGFQGACECGRTYQVAMHIANGTSAV